MVKRHKRNARRKHFLRKVVIDVALLILGLRSVYKELHADRETGC